MPITTDSMAAFWLLSTGVLALGLRLFQVHCLRGGRILLNPFLGMLGGISFYVLVPCIAIAAFPDAVGGLTLFGDYLTLLLANGVLALTASALVAFMAGAALPLARRRKARVQARCDERLRSIGVPWLLLWVSFAALLALAATIRQFLFAGYASDVLESADAWSARGAMSSFYTLIVVSASAVVLWSRARLGVRRWIGLGVVVAVASVLLLSIGARLYVAMGLITFLAVASMLREGISIRRFALAILSAALLFAVVGSLRTGSLQDIGGVLLNLALEPLLTSLSLFTLLADNPPIWIGRPWLFLGDLQAVLPSVLFPGKGGLFERLHEYGYAFDAPLGGYHLYFSMLINGGMVGTVIAFFALGWLCRRLSDIQPLPCRVLPLSGCVLSGMFMFSLFRDPFFISITKNIGLMGFFVPYLLCAIERLRRPGAFRAPQLRRVAAV